MLAYAILRNASIIAKYKHMSLGSPYPGCISNRILLLVY